MKMTKVLVLFSFFLLVFISGCGKNKKGDKVVLRLASVLPAEHPTSQAMEFFKNRLGEISNGKIEVQLFLNSQLGNATETIEFCQAGNIEMTGASVAPLTQFVPELNALSMPFIFRNSRHAYRVVDGPVGKLFAEKLRTINLHTVCFFDAESRNIMTKKGPITRPKDLRGMKIRVMSAPLMIDTVNALGASAIPMSQGEVYTALQTGVLDGWENNPPTTLTFKMYETGCIYYARTEHLMVPDLVLINKKLYDSLNEQMRGYINQAARETTEKQRELWTKGVKEAEDKLEKAGMKFNDVEKELFSKRVEKIYEEYYKKYGDEFKRICEQIKATK